MSYDTERFIMEIQKRQGIWNIRCDDYANKQKRKDLWLEMCHIFFPDFDEMSEVEKCQVENVLQKKWRNLRTCFMREINKQKSPTEIGLFPRRQYIYFNHLLFLRDIAEYRSSSILSAMDEESAEEPAEYFSIQCSNKFPAKSSSTHSNEMTKEEETSIKQTERKRKRSKTTDGAILKLLTKTVKRKVDKKGVNEDDADRLFLLSLLPEIKQIPREHSLNAKSDILLIIQKWKSLKSNMGLTMLSKE